MLSLIMSVLSCSTEQSEPSLFGHKWQTALGVQLPLGRPNYHTGHDEADKSRAAGFAMHTPVGNQETCRLDVSRSCYGQGAWLQAGKQGGLDGKTLPPR